MTLPLPMMLASLSKYQSVPKSNNNRTERVRKISSDTGHLYRFLSRIWYCKRRVLLWRLYSKTVIELSMKTISQNVLVLHDPHSELNRIIFDYSMRLTLYQFESKTPKWCVVPFLIWVVYWWLIAMIWRWMFAMGCYFDLVVFGYVFFLEVGGNPHQWTIGFGPIPRSCFD